MYVTCLFLARPLAGLRASPESLHQPLFLALEFALKYLELVF